MPLNQVSEILGKVDGLIQEAKSGESSADWGALLECYEQINSISKENEWTSMQDAVTLAETLVQQIMTGEDQDATQSSELLDTINSSLGKLVEDIKENGHVTISIKGVLAEARLFLGDFDYISTEEGGEKTEFEEGDIDVFDEFRKRVTNIENLVLGLDESFYDEEAIKTIFREYHTLKGEAGFTGLSELSNFCHKVESAIEPLRHKKIRLAKNITDILLFLTDICKSYIDNAHHSSPLPEESETDQNIETLKSHIAESEDLTTSTESSEPEVVEEESDESEFASMFPLDDDEEEAAGTKEKESPAAETEEVLVDQEPPPRKEPALGSTSSKDQKTSPQKNRRAADGQGLDMGVNMAKVDSLVDIAAELTILYQTIKQSPEVKSFASDRLTNDIDAMGRLFKDLQILMMSIRMTSISPLFNRLNRVIRDSSRQEKKNIEIKMSGTNTIIDKNLLDDISGGLVHMVRNSVGHGIEAPRDRIKAGKPEKGTISMKAFRDANNVVIEVRDDGKGISKDKVLEKALKQGLISSKEGMADQEIFNLLFLPGFSTADKVTGLSGRGVGMDVVKTSIEKVRGKIDLTSEEGKGTKVRLVLPFTFAIIEGLVVRVDHDLFIIPLVQVHEMISLETEEIMHMKGKEEFVDIRGKLLPLVRLGHLFSGKRNGNNGSESTKVVVSVEHDHKICALLVDEVIASQEIVLKELKGAFAHLKFVSAAGVLGNRRIGLVLDVGEITSNIYSRVDIEQIRDRSVKKRDEDQVEVVEIGTNQVAMIDFFVEFKNGGKTEKLLLAINAFKTKEFMAKAQTVQLPNAPKGFSGMLTLRGKTLPVFSLTKLMMPHLPDEDIQENLIIICEFSKKEVGFMVSGVNKVNYISWNKILPPPNTSSLIKTHSIVGTILRGKDVIFILDFEKLIESVMVLYDSLDSVSRKLKTSKTHNCILLVEDSNLMRKKLKEALEKMGLKVIEAENGKVALDKVDELYHLAQEKKGSIFDYIDLVLTDIEMPELDGYTFTKTIKSHPDLRVLPVLLHSSLSNETIIQRAKEVRADGFISKCSPEKIYEELEKYL